MKFQKGLLGILRDIHQIDAFRSPVHVELSESTETEMTFKKDCAWWVEVEECHALHWTQPNGAKCRPRSQHRQRRLNRELCCELSLIDQLVLD